MTNPILSAYASERWINCPPSQLLCRGHDVQLTEYYDDSACEGYGEHTNKDAHEGKECHRLAAYKLRKLLGQDATNPVSSLSCYTQEMDECAEDYCAFIVNRVRELIQRGANPAVIIEGRVDYSRYTGVEGSVGIADCIIVSNGTLHIYDLKYGRGISVSAESNTQLMLYALGALEMVGDRYDISAIRLTIYQPRRDNIHTCSMSKDELLSWASKVLYPAAQLAIEGNGEFCVGDHCRFCAIKAICRARADRQLELAEFCSKLNKSNTATLTTDEIAYVLRRVNDLVTWASDIKRWATEQAELGIQISGFKLVQGRNGQRKYTDEEVVARIVRNAGYEPYKHVLLNPAEMTRLLGKAQFDRLLSQYIGLSPGKPTLVPDDDVRPALSSAAEDFSQVCQQFSIGGNNNA